MRAYHYRYPVRLSKEQRRWLETMVHINRTPAKHCLVARVLLMSDQSQGQPSHTDGQKALALSISRRTVIRIKQRFVQENLEVALAGSFPRERPERRCLDGKGEAQLIALACSQAAFRTTTLDAGIVSRQDGATRLCGAYQPGDGENHAQKNELMPWRKKSWCFPTEADGEFVYHMEDVLDVYCQPYDPSVPRICMDEMGKNLIKDKYPASAGQAGTSRAFRL